MTINTQKLRDLLAILKDDGQEGKPQFQAAQKIMGAVPALLDHIDAQAARIEAQDIIVRSVAAALERHGVTEADDPGEAIDVLIDAQAAEIERLREALSKLTNDCESANQKWVDGIGIGAIDLNAISRGRAALSGESKC